MKNLRFMRAASCALLFGSLTLKVAAHEPTITVDGFSPEQFSHLQNFITVGIHNVGAFKDPCPREPINVGGKSRMSGCQKYYDKMFGHGEFTMGIGIGYLDPSFDGSSPDDRFGSVVLNLSRPCRPGVNFACGFERHEQAILNGEHIPIPGTSFTVLTKKFKYRMSNGETKTVTARVPICNPYTSSTDPNVKKLQQATCSALFAQSMKYDDVTAYVGHSRYGAGPDFTPPVVLPMKAGQTTPEIDHEYYEKHKLGVARFFSPEALAAAQGSKRPNPAYKQLYMLSCSSCNHFKKTIRESRTQAGYNDGNFDYACTEAPAFMDGTEPVRLLEALGSTQCGPAIGKAVANDADNRFDSADSDGLQVVIAPPKLDTTQLFNDSR